jgi:hypothetical protein
MIGNDDEGYDLESGGAYLEVGVKVRESIVISYSYKIDSKLDGSQSLVKFGVNFD